MKNREEKKKKKKEREEKRHKYINIFQVLSLNISWYFPHDLCRRHVLITIHRAVIENKKQFVWSAQEEEDGGGGAAEKKKRQSISRIDLSSVCSTEIPTSLSKLPLHLHIHNINLK